LKGPVPELLVLRIERFPVMGVWTMSAQRVSMEVMKMNSLTVKWMQLALLVSALGLSATALTGCNTSEGFGEDVESVGEDIQDEADEAR
jgi:predicted small secreted protein